MNRLQPYRSISHRQTPTEHLRMRKITEQNSTRVSALLRCTQYCKIDHPNVRTANKGMSCAIASHLTHHMSSITSNAATVPRSDIHNALQAIIVSDMRILSTPSDAHTQIKDSKINIKPLTTQTCQKTATTPRLYTDSCISGPPAVTVATGQSARPWAPLTWVIPSSETVWRSD